RLKIRRDPPNRLLSCRYACKLRWRGHRRERVQKIVGSSTGVARIKIAIRRRTSQKRLGYCERKFVTPVEPAGRQGRGLAESIVGKAAAAANHSLRRTCCVSCSR